MARQALQSDPAKRLFSHPRMAADLVRLLGDPRVEDLDLDRPERLPTEYISGDLRTRRADLPQTVTVTAEQHDDGVDGRATLRHTVTTACAAPGYPATLAIPSVEVAVDDDAPPPELRDLQPRLACRLIDAKNHAGEDAADGNRRAPCWRWTRPRARAGAGACAGRGAVLGRGRPGTVAVVRGMVPRHSESGWTASCRRWRTTRRRRCLRKHFESATR